MLTLDTIYVEMRSKLTFSPGEAPYTPGQEYVMFWLTGPIGAGIMAGINWRRLGKPGRFWLPIGAALGSMLLIGSILSVVVIHNPAIQQQTITNLIILVNSLVGWLVMLWIVESQRTAYTNWLKTHGSASLKQRGGWSSIINIVIWSLVLRGITMTILWSMVFMVCSLLMG